MVTKASPIMTEGDTKGSTRKTLEDVNGALAKDGHFYDGDGKRIHVNQKGQLVELGTPDKMPNAIKSMA